MRALFILGTIIFVSCRNTSETIILAKPPNSKETTLFLKDSLGSVSLSIPNRYDTFLVWTHFSDCSSCGYEKYRFQSASLPIYKENGWIWEDRKDSVDQFTIEHSQFIRRYDSLPANAYKSLHARMLDDAKYDPLMLEDKLRFDTIQVINGKEFSIIISNTYNDSTKIFSKTAWATTLLKGNRVKFIFTLRTHENDSICKNFMRDSKLYLNQIKVNGL